MVPLLERAFYASKTLAVLETEEEQKKQDDPSATESSDDKFLVSDIVSPDDDDLMGDMDTLCPESDNVESLEPNHGGDGLPDAKLLPSLEPPQSPRVIPPNLGEAQGDLQRARP